MKKLLFIIPIAVLVLFGLIFVIEARNEALAYGVLVQMSFAKNCHDLEVVASPELYEALGPCHESLFLDKSIMWTVQAEVLSCTVDRHFRKEGVVILMEDAEYSIVFRCNYSENEAGLFYAFMEKSGSTYKIVDVAYDTGGSDTGS